jgi:lysophospholipase L1-like esterase
LPLAALQAGIVRWRVPRLPPGRPPHHGRIAGRGRALRIVALGESSVSGVGLASGDEAVTAATARSLARMTGQPVSWRALGRSGASVRKGIEHLLPSLSAEPADLLLVAFGVNDVMDRPSPSGFADDLEELIQAARERTGQPAVVIAGVAPLSSFPALPSPLRDVLEQRAHALQAAAERLSRRLPRLVVQRFPPRLDPSVFGRDGFHPNALGHAIWGEQIAALALSLLDSGRAREEPHSRGRSDRRSGDPSPAFP